MNVEEQVYKAIPENDFTVLNNCEFMKIIDKCGFNSFKKALYKLEKENKIYFDYGSDGMLIYKK